MFNVQEADPKATLLVREENDRRRYAHLREDASRMLLSREF